MIYGYISAPTTPVQDVKVEIEQYATQNKFDVLIVANEEPKEMKFRKNFLEILDPSDFGKD